MATTTNYGWTTPDDTALVKDGASAIRTLGSSVDTTTKNLNPETTLGDLAYRSSTANVKTRLGLGTANQVLAVNSGATAPEWQTISAGGMTLISTTSLSGASVTLSSIPATYKNLQLVIRDILPASSGNNLRMRVNGDTATRYTVTGWSQATGTQTGFSLTQFQGLLQDMSSSVTQNLCIVDLFDYTNTVTYKCGSVIGMAVNVTDATEFTRSSINLWYNQTPAISSITLFFETGNITSGTALLYGVS